MAEDDFIQEVHMSCSKERSSGTEVFRYREGEENTNIWPTGTANTHAHEKRLANHIRDNLHIEVSTWQNSLFTLEGAENGLEKLNYKKIK